MEIGNGKTFQLSIAYVRWSLHMMRLVFTVAFVGL